MNSRPEQTAICDFIMHATPEDARKPESFYARLVNYLNRPFDNKKNVLQVMSEENRNRFNHLWGRQVEEIIQLENSLGFQFPVEDDLGMKLAALEDKLKTLVQPVLDDLQGKLDEELSSLADEERSRIPQIRTEIARAYCFHLLTDVIRLRPGMSAKEVLQFKAHQEFHRLARNALFSENIHAQFMNYVFEKFRDKNSLNEMDFEKYRFMLGRPVTQAFLDGVRYNLYRFERLEILQVMQILKRFQFDEKTDAVELLRSELRSRTVSLWLEYFRENLDNHKKLLEILNVEDDEHILMELKRSVLIHLAEISMSALAHEQKQQQDLIISIKSHASRFDQDFAGRLQQILRHNQHHAALSGLPSEPGASSTVSPAKKPKKRFHLFSGSRKGRDHIKEASSTHDGPVKDTVDTAESTGSKVQMTWKPSVKPQVSASTRFLIQRMPASTEIPQPVDDSITRADTASEGSIDSHTPSSSASSVWKKSVNPARSGKLTVSSSGLYLQRHLTCAADHDDQHAFNSVPSGSAFTT